MNQIHLTISNEARFRKAENIPLEETFPVWDPETDIADLTKDTSEEQVGCLLRSLTLMTLHEKKDFTTESTLEALIEAMFAGQAYIPGGLHFTGDDGAEIYPGCCCGIEDWQDIKSRLIQGQSPWMGHDPYPTLKVNEGVWLITTDSELDPLPEDYTYEEYYTNIPFTEEEFKKKLVWLDVEFYDFANGPLSAYLKKHQPEHAEKFCQAFRAHFGGLR